MSSSSLVIAAPIFLLAGFVKGVIGLGLPTLSIGMLSFLMPPAQAASLLIAPSLVTNIQQMRPWARLTVLLQRLWPMLAGVVLGTLLGAGWLTGQNTRGAAAGLGAALVVYAALGLAKVRFRVAARRESWLAPLVGIATGLVTAATGVFVIPAVPYLQAIGLEKDDLVQALGLSFFISTLALWGALVMAGVGPSGPALGSLAMLVPALIGQVAGQAVRVRINADSFRFWFLVGLLGLGGALVVRWLIG
jgi:uncharacterized protein